MTLGCVQCKKQGVFIAYTGLVIFIAISQVVFNKIIATMQWKIIATVLFLITLEEALFNIAFELRAEFGATWTSTEVTMEFVFTYWQSWVMLTISLVCYIGMLWRLSKMNKKNERTN